MLECEVAGGHDRPEAATEEVVRVSRLPGRAEQQVRDPLRLGCSVPRAKLLQSSCARLPWRAPSSLLRSSMEIALWDRQKRFHGGHLEEGCEILALAEIAITRLPGLRLGRRPLDATGVMFLGRGE